MRHNEFDREDSCDGELIEQSNLCTETTKVMWCLRCATEFRYTIGSTRVTIVYPGMRKSMDWQT
jgi:hypothetical protein